VTSKVIAFFAVVVVTSLSLVIVVDSTGVMEATSVSFVMDCVTTTVTVEGVVLISVAVELLTAAFSCEGDVADASGNLSWQFPPV